MIVPSKFITLDQSILSKSSSLQKILTHKRTISETFRSKDNPVDDINEFILSLDLLWLFDKVDIDPETGEFLRIEEVPNAL